MDLKRAKLKHAELLVLFAKWDETYHLTEELAVTDEEYDATMRVLRSLEQQHPSLITDESPTQRVGATPRADSLFTPISITHPMQSLDNVFTDEELMDWYEGIKKSLEEHTVILSAEFKLDGLAVRLIYDDGMLTLAHTRGDGKIGEDITAKTLFIKNVPQVLYNGNELVLGHVEITGEVVASRETFESINAELIANGKKPFAAPRNYAVGSLRASDDNVTAARSISFIAYETSIPDTEKGGHGENLNLLEDLGFTTSTRKEIADVDRLAWAIEYFGGLRDDMDYDTDGVVFKVDAYAQRKSLGITRRSPRYSVAYKFPATVVRTLVDEIIVQVGRTGAITPVALLTPIRVAGANITRATLHNEDEIDRLDLAPGDIVELIRSGEVIPKIERVVIRGPAPRQVFAMPTQCLCCATPLVKDGAKWFCTNDLCEDRILAGLEYFAGRSCANIKYLGEKGLELLYKERRVVMPSLIYELDELELMLTLGDAVGKKVYASIQMSKNMPLDRFLMSLGIEGAAIGTCQRLSAHYGTLDALLATTVEELEKIVDIGPDTANAVYSYINDPTKLVEIKRLVWLGVTSGKGELAAAGPLEGQIWTITGTFENNTRDFMSRTLKSLGATVNDKITKKHTHLLAGVGGGEKRDKADKFGIPILTEEDYETLVKSHQE